MAHPSIPMLLPRAVRSHQRTPRVSLQGCRGTTDAANRRVTITFVHRVPPHQTWMVAWRQGRGFGRVGRVTTAARGGWGTRAASREVS